MKEIIESKCKLQESLITFKLHLEKKQISSLNEDYQNILDDIKTFYDYIDNLNDETILFLSEYVMLFELIITKIKKNGFKINHSQKEVFYKIIKKFNINQTTGKLENIRKEADDVGLLFNFDELLEEIKLLHPEKSLREVIFKEERTNDI